MRIRRYLMPLLALLLTACSRNVPAFRESGPVTVGFFAGESGGICISRTEAGEDGLSTFWQGGDRIALWALSQDGTAVLEAQPFKVSGISGTSAFFTSTLESEMAGGEYTYFASYPLPEQISGGKAYFTIPSLQDGRCTGGEDIMFSDRTVAGPLKAIDWEDYSHSEMQLGMNHLLHRLRFYLTDATALNGEAIQEMAITFPRSVAGKIAVDTDSPQAGEIIGGGSNTIYVNLPEPVAASSSKRNYINISILPCTFAAGEKMSVTLYTTSKYASFDIPLQGRTFAAGHSTPVLLIPRNGIDIRRLHFRLDSNNLGEEVNRIDLTAPDGCTWGETGSGTLTFNPNGDITVGTTFYVEFRDVDKFNAFSGKEITVTYNSEHVEITDTVNAGDIAGKPSATVGLNVPYLLYEDFSSVPTFSSNDNYSKGFITGDKDSHAFLGGWAGGRCGAQLGKCIRIACRRETSADYPARVDSAPLKGRLKKSANISVEFDYGADNEFGGIPIVTDGNVGQDCHIGYITTTSNYKSGSSTGTYEKSNTFYVKEYTGSYDSTPNHDSYILHDVPATDVIRISWRTIPEHQDGTTNTTVWLYIDNVKIKISKQ